MFDNSDGVYFAAPFNNMRTLKFKGQPTVVFRYRQSNIRPLRPASDGNSNETARKNWVPCLKIT